MVKLVVDNQTIEADEGAPLLQVCLENDIYIPNLCWIKEMQEAPVSCRLCFVEVEGEPLPVPSCKTPVKEGLVARTDAPEVRRLQKSAFQLLMSDHEINCKPCPANKKCELQKIARFLKTSLKPKQLEPHRKEAPPGLSHPGLELDINRCVLCGRCIHTCTTKQGRPFLTFARRGIDTVVGFYGASDAMAAVCSECLACVDICPVRAILPAEEAGVSQ